MTGVFAAGRIINPKTARSQIIGGMTMGLGMALHEESLVDARFGHVLNHDFASYHIPANADIGQFDIAWIDEEDTHVNPMGSKGIGEIGIVGAAAAIANAVYHATGSACATCRSRRPNFCAEASSSARQKVEQECVHLVWRL